jgi:hypothetical protein
MPAEFFRRMAQQCRELIVRARTEAAKSQLRVSVEKFEAQAEAAEREAERNRDGRTS